MVARRQEHSDYNRQTESSSKKRVRLTFDLDDGLRRRIKLQALKQDLTINEYLTRVLDDVVPAEETNKQARRQPVSREAIERLLHFREELIKETNGTVFDDTAELIREEREKRINQLTGEE